MNENSNRGPHRPHRFVQALVLVAAGIIIGRLTDDPGVLHADVRKGERREAFLSGGERSEQVLREISKTLSTIDERLARFEKASASNDGRTER